MNFLRNNIKILLVIAFCVSLVFLPKKVVELISLGLTVPTIILGLGVLRFWGKQAIVAFRKPSQERTGVDWLILGVAVGFLGAAIDNAYWGIAWTLSYLEHPYKDWWFNHGVYCNVPFRQISGLYAAWCHLQSSAKRQTTKLQDINKYNRLSWSMGILYMLLLIALASR